MMHPVRHSPTARACALATPACGGGLTEWCLMPRRPISTALLIIGADRRHVSVRIRLFGRAACKALKAEGYRVVRSFEPFTI